MILVTVGTQKFQMDRLLKAVDELAQIQDELFFVQKGHSIYTLSHCDNSAFLSKEDMEEKINQCSVMISHAGVGSILLGLKKQKKIIVVPRMEMFGEHVDDHQVEIAEAFANAGYVRMAMDVSSLAVEIESCKNWIPMKFESNKDKFNQLILDIVMGE